MAIICSRKYDDMLSCFDTEPDHDRWTGRRMDRISIMHQQCHADMDKKTITHVSANFND